MALARLRPARSLAVGAVLLTSALLVSGCSAIFGPEEAQRDEPNGEVTAASDADVFSLQIGDCINQAESDAETEEFASLPVVPCAEPHNGEVYAELELEDGDFPGATTVEDQAMEHCHGQFEAFVGLSYDESTLIFWPMFPSEQSWELEDDRVIQCFVGPESMTETVTGTLAGAAV
ncbi:septum formation family protein [Oerskovia enterophila]